MKNYHGRRIETRRYDPFADMEALLLDVVWAGEQVAACDSFFEYAITNDMLPLRDAGFWLHGDFFAKHPDESRPVLDALMAFVERYGLPAWEVQSMAYADYPARYASRLMSHRHNPFGVISTPGGQGQGGGI